MHVWNTATRGQAPRTHTSGAIPHYEMTNDAAIRSSCGDKHRYTHLVGWVYAGRFDQSFVFRPTVTLSNFNDAPGDESRAMTKKSLAFVGVFLAGPGVNSWHFKQRRCYAKVQFSKKQIFILKRRNLKLALAGFLSPFSFHSSFAFTASWVLLDWPQINWFLFERKAVAGTIHSSSCMPVASVYSTTLTY